MPYPRAVWTRLALTEMLDESSIGFKLPGREIWVVTVRIWAPIESFPIAFINLPVDNHSFFIVLNMPGNP
jgi:hypothetical protein